MAHHQVETQWMGKMQFNSLVNGHTVIMDAPPHVGGENNGPIPKPFVLTALSGCTGMDVVALLRKAGITLQDFSLKVDGELSKQQPLEYVSIHLVYDTRGEADDKNEILHAINTSQEKLCGVSHMLKKALPVTWEVIFNNHLIFSNAALESSDDNRVVV